MTGIHSNIEKLWWSHNEPPALLRLASHAYSLINRLNLTARQKRSVATPIPMISVGNLTAGGSGKTPFVIWLAGVLKNAGFKPVVVCRGDGGSSKEPQILDSKSDPLIVGDEAVLLFQKCGCPVIAAQDRVRASLMAAEYGDIMILDDGFQYRQLQRACDIVLIPAEGLGNGHLIPAGPLRESVAALERADLIVRSGRFDEIKPLTVGKEWRWWSHEQELLQLKGGRAEAPKQAVVLTAIARPERLNRSLERLAIQIEASYHFPDHHPFLQGDIEMALNHRLAVIATAKDAVKLLSIWPDTAELWVLEQRPEAEPGLFEAIQRCLDMAQPVSNLKKYPLR